MHKSNTNSEEIFDNNDENIKIIEKLPQVKIWDSSIILYLHYSTIIYKQDFWKISFKLHSEVLISYRNNYEGQWQNISIKTENNVFTCLKRENN